jgi:hypothetical protein
MKSNEGGGSLCDDLQLAPLISLLFLLFHMRNKSPHVVKAAAAAQRPPAVTFTSDAGAIVAALSWTASFLFCVYEALEFSKASPPPSLEHSGSGAPSWRPDTSAATATIGGMTAAFALLHVALKLVFKSPTTTFYLEHTIVNAVIVALVWRDTLATLFYPLSCMRSNYAILPTYAQVRQSHCHTQLLPPSLRPPPSPSFSSR